MLRRVLLALIACTALGSTQAFAQSNCRVCLDTSNKKVNEIWSCSSPYNPSGGQYAVIDSYHLAQDLPALGGDSRWCAMVCPVTPASDTWW